MPLTSIVACQIFAIADVPGRREELPPPPLSQAFVSLIFDGGFMNNTDVGQFGNLSKRTAGLEVLAEGRAHHACIGTCGLSSGSTSTTSPLPMCWIRSMMEIPRIGHGEMCTPQLLLWNSHGSRVPPPLSAALVCRRLVSVLSTTETVAHSPGIGA